MLLGLLRTDAGEVELLGGDPWRRRLQVGPLQAGTLTFLAERAEAGLSCGTIDLTCSAIAHQHHQEGLPDSTTDITLGCVRRIIGAAPRSQAHPLTVAEVNRIVTAMDLDTATGVRDRALLLLGYASALRPSELSALISPTSSTDSVGSS